MWSFVVLYYVKNFDKETLYLKDFAYFSFLLFIQKRMIWIDKESAWDRTYAAVITG